MAQHDRLLSELKPYENNAKKHPKSQVEHLASLIKRFGFTQPLAVDEDFVVIIGHGRLLAAQKLGIKKIRLEEGKAPKGADWVPVVQLLGLTPEEKIALRIADNKSNESAWEMAKVIIDLKVIPVELQEITGFSTSLATTTDEKDDAAPEAPEVPKSELGDVYALGVHRLACGDSTSPTDMSKLMGEQKADLIFTDPPYNVDYEGRTKEKLKIKNDKQNKEAFLQFLRDAFTTMAQVIKRGAATYVCHADSNGLEFRQAFSEAGFSLKQCLIWNKNHIVLGRHDYQWKHEPILYGWMEGATHQFHGGRSQTTVWDISKPNRSDKHPTMKPVELIVKAVMNSSKEEDIVLDPFGGSGSTLIGCEKTGRTCYTMELDPKYVDVIIARWEEYTGKKAKKL